MHDLQHKLQPVFRHTVSAQTSPHHKRIFFIHLFCSLLKFVFGNSFYFPRDKKVTLSKMVMWPLYLLKFIYFFFQCFSQNFEKVYGKVVIFFLSKSELVFTNIFYQHLAWLRKQFLLYSRKKITLSKVAIWLLLPVKICNFCQKIATECSFFQNFEKLWRKVDMVYSRYGDWGGNVLMKS